MDRNRKSLPTLTEIKEVLSYLPKLYGEGFSPVIQWEGGRGDGNNVFQAPWPKYHPIVEAFFQTLGKDCWLDFNYNPAEAQKMLSDEIFIKTADLAQIKTMLTYCTRAERFGDGAWEGAIIGGTIRQLLERLDAIRAEIEHNQV